MDERTKWRDVIGYEGLYRISEYGDVKSLERMVKKAHGIRVIKEKTLKIHMSNGYKKVFLSKGGKSKQFYIHRLIATSFIRQPIEREVVNHIDGNKLNNHYSNLEWCTYGENNKHARDNNLWKSYSFNHYTSKFTKEDISEIRKLASEGKTYTDIANRYMVCKETVGMVVRKEIYAPNKKPNDCLANNKTAKNIGKSNGSALLTEKEVMEIRELYKLGNSMSGLAKMFKVSKTNIHLIVNKKSWKHIS